MTNNTGLTNDHITTLVGLTVGAVAASAVLQIMEYRRKNRAALELVKD